MSPLPVLRLLDGVHVDDRPVTGERSQALLAALVAADGHAVTEPDLVRAVWGDDDRPANPGKALQVVVSRTRAQTGPDLVLRVDGGYRIGLPARATDVGVVAAAVTDATRAESAGDAALARDRARDALAVAIAGEAAAVPLIEVRDEARARQTQARLVLGRALSALGEHVEALRLLEGVPESEEPDEPTLAARLRSQAAVHGAPHALGRYEAHREALRDRLGVDPGPQLQAVHAELLAADNPVRTGLEFETTPLVGRDDDVRRLRALVRESRVTSILGPGGLGKTRLAHLLGRGAEQPIVHFVELVGVASPDDVVGEVGSALGVRDSVAGRRVLTAEQRADVRARIAQQLDQAPTLLILDNCEHVVEAVADLVAVLVATTRQVRVVTTTRAPLAIAAERIFALDQLDDASAAELFRQRARAARPGVRLADDEVRRVVARLDGLPLAIELAAAKVRAMSVADIDRRLDDRFTLLRGSDRGAPDRHQTLLAVIEWSWNLLGEGERRALGRLALFQDGFALEGAEAVVGVDALAALESLAGQSLLTVHDEPDGGGLRYRMLETVREFGLLRLRQEGEESGAREAVRAWALALCARTAPELYGPDQIAAVRAIRVEENNLGDVLRQCLAAVDPAGVVTVLGALGGHWTIRGDHGRVVVLIGAVEDVLTGWEPPAALRDHAARVAAVVVMNTAVAELPQPRRCQELLVLLGPHITDPRVRAMARLFSEVDPADLSTLARLADDPDRHTAIAALQWISHAAENDGDMAASIRACRRALDLWRPDDGPWGRALMHTQLAGAYTHTGRLELAAEHARLGLSVLDDLQADDDAVQVRAVMASAAIMTGDIAGAERLLAEILERYHNGLWGGTIMVTGVRAEITLARGDVDGGLALYEEAVVATRRVTFPGATIEPGFEPWTLFSEAAAVAASARYGTGVGHGEALAAELAAKAPTLVEPGRRRIDYPVIGCVLFALGLWRLLREHDRGGIALLGLAERCSYNQFAPSMAWSRALADAEAAAPGALAQAIAHYGDRRGVALLDEVRAALAGLTG